MGLLIDSFGYTLIAIWLISGIYIIYYDISKQIEKHKKKNCPLSPNNKDNSINYKKKKYLTKNY